MPELIQDEQPARPGLAPAILIRVKVVPGSTKDAIAGLLGDRLKVRVSQPPEGGKANRAVCELLADALGLAPSMVSVVQGASNPQKTLRAMGITQPEAMARLGLP